MSFGARQLAESAMALSLATLLGLLFLFTPLSSLIPLMLPSVYLIHSARSALPATIVLVLATALVYFFLGGWPMVAFALIASVCGAVMGWVYRHQKDAWLAISGGWILLLVLLSGGAYIWTALGGTNPVSFLTEALRETFSLSVAWLEEMSELSAEEQEWILQIPEQMVRLLPFFVILTTALVVFSTHWLGGTILRRLDEDVPRLPAFRTWQLPKAFLFMYLIVMLLYLFAGSSWLNSVENVLINLNTIFEVLFVVQGLSVIDHFSVRAGRKHLFTVLSFIALVIPPFTFLALPALSLLGVVEVGFGLRSFTSRREK